MVFSGRSTPPAREDTAQLRAKRISAAVASPASDAPQVPQVVGIWPQQSSTTQMVESSTMDDSHKERPLPAAAPIDTGTVVTKDDDADAPTHSSRIAATSNAATTTASLEKETPPASRGGHTRRPGRSWRSWSVCRRLSRWLSEQHVVDHVEAISPNVESAEEDFCRYIRIIYRGVNDDHPKLALAKFDTQCPEDYISVAFLKATWGEDLRSRPTELVANTLNGGLVHSFGSIDLAWSSRDHRSHSKLFFNPKTYQASFQVIDTEDFDVVIGRATIAKQKLLVFHRYFGLFKAHRHASHKLTPSQISDSQARANVRRAEAAQLRSQVAAQSTQASAAANTQANNGS